MKPLVAIIILNWNQEKLTAQCLESLKGIDYDNYSVIVVDNGSTDASEARIKEKFPGIKLIKNKENTGFAEGNNIGARYGLDKGADYIFLLNNDTKVEPDIIKRLVETAESEQKIGITGAINYYYDQPDKIYSAGGYFNWWTSKLTRLDGGVIKKLGWEVLKKIHFVPGSSILIKRAVFEKIGFLDPRFFIYYEEADLCVRAKKAGYRVVSVKRAKILHKVAVIFKRYSPVEYYLYTRNLLLFMKKNCPRYSIISFFLCDVIKIFFRVINLFFTGRRKEAGAVAFGFIDFFKNSFGKGRIGLL